MRVSSIHLRNFKRFTDLVINGIPPTAKLVLVVGPNGCGKSSLFEAFLTWYRGSAGFGVNTDDKYYPKDTAQSYRWNTAVTVNLHDAQKPEKGSLYIRTAYRNDPDFSVSGLSRHASPSQELRVGRVIDNDQTVQANYHRLVYETMAGVYSTANDAKNVGQLREELIGDVRQSTRKVFGNLVLNSISDPLGDGTFFFKKGEVDSYHYKNLSGGEKAAFDLLLDIHIKKKYFTNAVYCIDEIETHLHTKVQGRLLQEIVHVTPDSAQLWITTHSLGVLRGAQELASDDPDSVCVIDFDGIELDQPNEIHPSSLGRVSWQKCLSIALDDLSHQISPKYVIVCEGSSLGSRRQNFDATVYSKILGEALTDVVFVSGGGSSEIGSLGARTRNILTELMPSSRLFVVRDRDDLSEQQVEDLRNEGTFVLPRRNLESFLLDDEVLFALAPRNRNEDVGNPEQEIARIKQAAVEDSISRGNPPDDMKSAAGLIYTELKKSLQLTRCGGNTDSFMRDTLAPLIRSEMHCFQELRDFFEKLLRSGTPNQGH